MAIGINEAAALERANGAFPPLEQGDRLTRAEFERRYEAMRHLKKAELIEGRVYMPSPVKPPHGRPHSRMTGWLLVYEAATPGVASTANTTVRFDEDNEPQPDVLLAIEPSYGGQSRVDEDGYLSGSPELLVEIASSSVSYGPHDDVNQGGWGRALAMPRRANRCAAAFQIPQLPRQPPRPWGPPPSKHSIAVLAGGRAAPDTYGQLHSLVPACLIRLMPR